MKRIGGIGPLSPNTLIVIVAIYVALFANTALFSSAFEIYNGGAEEILFATSLLPFVAAVFIVVLSALCHRAAAKPILIAFLLLSSIIAYFMNQYGVIIDDDMLVNVLETDTGEASDLLSFAFVPVCLDLGRCAVPVRLQGRAEPSAPQGCVDFTA